MIQNKIICGDCLDKMQEYIPAETVDLIYLDPPFFSGRDYEVVWHDGSETRSCQLLLPKGRRLKARFS